MSGGRHPIGSNEALDRGKPASLLRHKMPADVRFGASAAAKDHFRTFAGRRYSVAPRNSPCAMQGAACIPLRKGVEFFKVICGSTNMPARKSWQNIFW